MHRAFFKRRRILTIVAFVAVGGASAAELPPGSYTKWSIEREIFVPMRDGVHLSTTVVHPTGAPEKLPAILVRAPYDDTSKWFPNAMWLDFFARQGYAIVLQDERGKGFSEGTYTNLLQGASTDGYDTIEWIVKQPWSNGKVAGFGYSSSGDTQWLMAGSNPPGLAAIIPGSTWTVGNMPGNATQGAFYRGGVPMFGVWAWWYAYSGLSERLLLPPHSTQEQRIRLRNSYSQQFLFSKDFFMPSHDPGRAVVDPSLFLHLPSQDVVRQFGGAETPFDQYITWTPGDKRWDQVELIDAGIQPRAPALHVTTWHDGAAGEVTRLFEYLQDHRTPNQYLIIGAGPHGAYFGENQLTDFKVGDLEIGDARYGGDEHGYQRLFLNWFEHWLKGEDNHVTEMPKVQLYILGQGWISGDHWPLKETRYRSYYLGGGAASGFKQGMGTLSGVPSNREQHDGYIYDPAVPTPSHGGAIGSATGDAVTLDQRPIEARKDVLVYSTPPLDESVTIAGPVQVVLFVSSSAKDTDFMVKLVDVYPDGKAINLCDDAFRMRYREGFDKKVLMQPAHVYKISLSDMVTATRFPKGHRIRLDVSSSNFPEYERNLNTGGNNYDETSGVVAENNVHHGPKYQSHIVLPVLPQ
jgi:putative CocE/NonD family hydrolase